MKSVICLLGGVCLTVAAAACAGCGSDPDCNTPTSVGAAGRDQCSIGFEDVGDRQCFGAAYRAECVRVGDAYECQCIQNGALVGTCTNQDICASPGVDNTSTILYVEQCCGWSIYPPGRTPPPPPPSAVPAGKYTDGEGWICVAPDGQLAMGDQPAELASPCGWLQSDGTFACTFPDKSISGTWRTTASGLELDLVPCDSSVCTLLARPDDTGPPCFFE